MYIYIYVQALYIYTCLYVHVLYILCIQLEQRIFQFAGLAGVAAAELPKGGLSVGLGPVMPCDALCPCL